MRLRFTFCSSALWFVLSTLMDIQEWDSSCVLFARQLLGVTLGKWALCILRISYCSHTGLLSPPGTHRGALAVHSAGMLFFQIAPWPTLSIIPSLCLNIAFSVMPVLTRLQLSPHFHALRFALAPFHFFLMARTPSAMAQFAHLWCLFFTWYFCPLCYELYQSRNPCLFSSWCLPRC